MKIKVARSMQHYVPGYVFQQAPFTPIFKEFSGFDPVFQEQQLVQFLANPTRRAITIIGDTTETVSASRYLAVWMAQVVNEKSLNRTPLYVYCDDAVADEYTGVVYAPEMKIEDEPCCLVVSMNKTATPVQLERARDIIAKWPSIPSFIQCSRQPIHLAAELGLPCHRAFYLTALKENTI